MDTELEIWKKIPSFPRYYEASNLGNIRSLDRRVTVRKNGKTHKKFYPGVVLSKIASSENHRYFYVMTCIKGKRRNLSVHRLVWSAFNRKIYKGEQVDHIDFNSFNNNAKNLQISNPKHNTERSAIAGRHKRKTRHLSDLDISVIKKSRGRNKFISRIFNIGLSTVDSIRGNRTFKYIEAYNGK